VALVAERSIREWLASAYDTEILLFFAPEFGRNVTILQANVGTASDAVSEADNNLAQIAAVVRSAAAAVGLPAGLSRVLDPGANEMPAEDSFSAYVAAGHEVALHNTETAIEIDQRQQQHERGVSHG
jgi:hypothetical protein